MAIKFKDGGRDFSGCDCRGLVGLILKECFAIEIPDVVVSCMDVFAVDTAIRKNNYWKKVDKPGWPCILLFCTEEPNRISHMGLYIGNKDFIHINKGFVYPAITSMSHPYWSMAREGFYVPKER